MRRAPHIDFQVKAGFPFCIEKRRVDGIARKAGKLIARHAASFNDRVDVVVDVAAEVCRVVRVD